MNNHIINPALEKYAELIIKKINEVSASDWKKPWFTTSFVGSPQNLSGKKYHNLNKALLYAVCDLNSYKTPVFLTFNQAQQESIQILKGVKSFPITFYDLYIKNVLTGERISKEIYDGLSSTVQNQYKVLPIQKFYNVFNLDQTNFSDKYPVKWEELKKHFAVKEISITNDIDNQYSNQLIDSTLKNQTWVCPIEIKNQNKAFYSMSEDKITIPMKQQFSDGKDFYYTALHEMAHSTGSTTRLNRTFGSRFGDNKYAKEELVAELSSAVVGKDMGLSVLPREENAQYLKSWLSGLKEDPKYLMSILQDVSKATTMIESTIGLENNYATTTNSDKKAESVGNITHREKYVQELRSFQELLTNYGFTETSAETCSNYMYKADSENDYSGIIGKYGDYNFAINYNATENQSYYYIFSNDPKIPERINDYASLKNHFTNIVQYNSTYTKPTIEESLYSNKSYYPEKVEFINKEVVSSGSKTLIADISISQTNDKPTVTLENPRIKDKSTGLTEPLNTDGIDIRKQPADTVKKLLSGGKVQTSSLGTTQVLGLNKTPLGWGISIGKQAISTTDATASI